MNPLKKVMIVEDDDEYRRMLSNALYMNYEVMEAEDGEQAMERILLHRPHAVVLDLLLPKVDGFEVLKRIRTYPEAAISSTPVVVLSNLSSNQDFLNAENLKVDYYFVKSNTSMEDVQKKLGEIVK